MRAILSLRMAAIMSSVGARVQCRSARRSPGSTRRWVGPPRSPRNRPRAWAGPSAGPRCTRGAGCTSRSRTAHDRKARRRARRCTEAPPDRAGRRSRGSRRTARRARTAIRRRTPHRTCSPERARSSSSRGRAVRSIREDSSAAAGRACPRMPPPARRGRRERRGACATWPTTLPRGLVRSLTGSEPRGR